MAVSPFYIQVSNWVWISLVKGLDVLLYDIYQSGVIH